MKVGDIKTGEVRAETNKGEIRNAFPEVLLTDKFKVVVASLAIVTKGEVTPIFNIFVQKPWEGTNRIRILAQCIGENECSQQHLVDDPKGLATEFFVPYEGQVLDGGQMPKTFAHHFGVFPLTNLETAEAFYAEIQAQQDVGRVVRT